MINRGSRAGGWAITAGTLCVLQQGECNALVTTHGRQPLSRAAVSSVSGAWVSAGTRSVRLQHTGVMRCAAFTRDGSGRAGCAGS